MTASAAGVLKSSSSAAANRSQAPADSGSDGERKTSRNRAARARAFGTTRHGAEVARIGDLVEAGDERSLAGDELVRVRVAIRLAPGHDSLVVACPGRVRELALGLDLQPRAVPEPRLRGGCAFARPELEHLAAPAQRLVDGAAAVDLLARHWRRTSR